jgi:PAS domain S-box-containing protein
VELNDSDFRDLAESAVVGLHCVAQDGTVLWVNQAELDMLGYTRDEYLGHHISEFHADTAVIDDMLRRLRSGEILREYESRMLCKDGTVRHVQTTSSAQFENGRFLHTRCFTVDVTERKKLEAALQESERRLREIVDALPAAIYTTDAKGRLTHFNKSAVEFSGRVPELGSDEWCVTWKLYRPDGTLLPHDQCPMAIALVEGRAVYGEEAIAERPDGTRRWFTPFPTPLRDAHGQIVGGVNLLLDITDRKQTEQASNLLAAVVDSSDDAIVSKNLDGIITSWNKGAEHIFGYTAKEAVGQHITLIIPDNRLSEETMILSKLRAGERIAHFDTVRRRKDGTLIDVSITVSPVRDGSGRIIGASKVARDVTDRKKLERQKTELSNFAAELNRASSSEQVYGAALETICRVVGCDRSSILRLDDDKVMRFVSWRGLSDGYRRAVEGHTPWKPNDKDPRPVCIPNIEVANLESSLKSTVRNEGIRALAFVPLVIEGQLIGKFMTYFAAPHDFDVAEIDLTVTIARQLAVAIERQRSAEALRESEQRFRRLSETLDAEVRARTRELEHRSDDLVRQSQRVRELSWRLLRSQDEERRRIARELHDSAGQTLTVLGMSLAQVAHDMERSAPHVFKKIENTQELVQQLHQEIRTTSYLVHPPLLDESGLCSALAWYTEGLTERTGLKIDLRVPDDFGRLASDIELVLFRLVQECLTNIHRHAEASSVLISIAHINGNVALEVSDDGKGMSPEKLAEIQLGGFGVGIRGMQERVRQLCGTINIDSNRAGTRVSVTIPVPADTMEKKPEDPQPLQAAV